MIARLRGTPAGRGPEGLLLDVNGVGYRVAATPGVLQRAEGGGELTVETFLHVREDALLLYGFASREERRAFEQLIAISGVGPRTALAVLSGIGVEDLERAVREGDRVQLERIPGIGRKTAERVILELRDRLDREREPRRRRGAAAPPEAGRPGAQPAPLRTDAVSALVHLGYSRDAASEAVDRALTGLGPSATIESALKAALRGLVR